MTTKVFKSLIDKSMVRLDYLIDDRVDRRDRSLVPVWQQICLRHSYNTNAPSYNNENKDNKTIIRIKKNEPKVYHFDEWDFDVLHKIIQSHESLKTT